MKLLAIGTLLLMTAMATQAEAAKIKRWPPGYRNRWFTVVMARCEQLTRYNQPRFCRAAASCTTHRFFNRYPTLTSAKQAGLRRMKQDAERFSVYCGKANRHLIRRSI